MRTREADALSLAAVRIFQLNGLLTEIGNRLARPSGLTSARWWVLACVRDAPLSVAGIAKQLEVSRQGVQRIADELVTEGFAHYAANPGHARAKWLMISDKGFDALKEVEAAQALWANKTAQGLDIDELNLAVDVLTVLAERFRTT
jgi:DNA-binding MarR family transcriptional regulator